MSQPTLISIREKLDQIGPGFCLAKFFETSLHLESGHVHSCVHPKTHLVSVLEIAQNASALHNSAFKKNVRQQMLEGKRPTECGYCWNLESAGQISDRVYFSASHLHEATDVPRLVQSLGSTHNYFPSRVEVSFSTACNFKCAYCSPEVSSRWMKDLKDHGPIILNQMLYTLKSIQDNGKMPIDDEDENQWIRAFWQWLPFAYQHIKDLRITGGEPLMSGNTFRLIDWIEQNPKQDLQLGINSNLGVPEVLIDRLVLRLQDLVRQKTVAGITIWTSGEASGRQAEYIRFGLNYQEWLQNIRKLLVSVSGLNIRIMTTYSALNMGNYLDFLNDTYDIKNQFPGRVIVDSHTYLQYPKLMAIDILTEDFLADMAAEVSFIKNHPAASEHEIFQAERCMDYFQKRLTNPWSDLDFYRADFYRFFKQFDQRSHTDFLSTFPRLRDFYFLCESLIDE